MRFIYIILLSLSLVAGCTQQQSNEKHQFTEKELCELQGYFSANKSWYMSGLVWQTLKSKNVDMTGDSCDDAFLNAHREVTIFLKNEQSSSENFHRLVDLATRFSSIFYKEALADIDIEIKK